MKVQDSNSANDGDYLKTTENFVYTDDYQTEDAFSQIPVLNEFVEEETQEIPSPPRQQSGCAPASEAFPAIEKLQTFREKPKNHLPAPKSENEKKRTFKFPKFRFPAALRAFSKTLYRTVKGSSKQAILISFGTVLLSGCLIILGFISLHT